jgi:hypothetical protein
MSPVPVWILYWDPMLRRKAFAGPFACSPLAEADANRLREDGCSDVETIRARSMAAWMPPLRLDLPLPAWELRAVALKGTGLCVITCWDNVAQAFEGQTVEVASSDGEKFEGWVVEIDVAVQHIWVGLAPGEEEHGDIPAG